jgi:ABC-type multidrug transport system fused ATPase/permease subunit
LVCDEATASVDAEADARIQAAIRTDFASCTVLTVAHRLDSVVGCDAVAVLVPGGMLAQYGEPHQLLTSSRGAGQNVFAAMVDATGATHAAQLRAMAAQAHVART